MFKKLFLTSFLFFCMVGVIFPSKKESTELFNYCYSFEKLLSRNSIQKKKNLSLKIKSISKDVMKLGLDKSQGSLINKMINKYKVSKNNFIITFFPNKFYCFAGYWIENLRPGTFEAILYEKSIQKLNQVKDIKDEADDYLKDFKSNYEIIKKELNSIF